MVLSFQDNTITFRKNQLKKLCKLQNIIILKRILQFKRKPSRIMNTFEKYKICAYSSLQNPFHSNNSPLKILGEGLQIRVYTSTRWGESKSHLNFPIPT